MTATLMSALQRERMTVDVLERPFSKTVASVGKFSLRKCLMAVKLIAKLIFLLAGSKPDIVIFFITTRSFSFIVDVFMAEILRVSRVRVIAYPHTAGYARLAARGTVTRFLARRLLSVSQRVVVLGERLVADVAWAVPISGIRVVHNATDAGPRSPQKPRTGTNVLFFSNLLPEKGIDVFVDVATAMSDAKGAKFRAAGASTDEQFLSQLMARSGGDVEFVGAVTSSHDRGALFEWADVLLFPSRYPFEAQPLTIIEAMSFGVPTIAFDIGGIADLIEDERTGFLVDPSDFQGLIDRVKLLSENKELLSTMKDEARQAYETRHSVGVYQRQWRDIINSRRAD